MELSNTVFVPAYEVVHLRAAKAAAAGGGGANGVAGKLQGGDHVEVSENLAYGAFVDQTVSVPSTFVPLPDRGGGTVVGGEAAS